MQTEVDGVIYAIELVDVRPPVPSLLSLLPLCANKWLTELESTYRRQDRRSTEVCGLKRARGRRMDSSSCASFPLLFSNLFRLAVPSPHTLVLTASSLPSLRLDSYSIESKSSFDLLPDFLHLFVSFSSHSLPVLPTKSLRSYPSLHLLTPFFSVRKVRSPDDVPSRALTPQNTPFAFLLVGNKCDLPPTSRTVTAQQGLGFARQGGGLVRFLPFPLLSSPCLDPFSFVVVSYAPTQSLTIPRRCASHRSPYAVLGSLGEEPRQHRVCVSAARTVGRAVQGIASGASVEAAGEGEGG